MPTKNILFIGMLSSQLKICYNNIMKCDFCENPKYVERINAKGILENFCTICIEKLVASRIS
jgi:uncharacterized Fe-S radical SAM superfamily protein PflX